MLFKAHFLGDLEISHSQNGSQWMDVWFSMSFDMDMKIVLLYYGSLIYLPTICEIHFVCQFLFVYCAFWTAVAKCTLVLIFAKFMDSLKGF